MRRPGRGVSPTRSGTAPTPGAASGRGRRIVARPSPGAHLGAGAPRREPHLTVAVRIRPPPSEDDLISMRTRVVRGGDVLYDTLAVKWRWDISSAPRTLTALVGDKATAYPFSYLYGPQQNTRLIYAEVARPIVHRVVDGFNGCIFAYGQTNSGKTHTVSGVRHDPGILPLACIDIFEAISALPAGRIGTLRVSYLEIYKEQLLDLLAPSASDGASLDVAADTHGSVSVRGLSEHAVGGVGDVLELLARGDARRTVGRNNVHEHASRSHAIFTLHFESSSIAPTSPTGSPSHTLSEGVAPAPPAPTDVRVSSLSIVDLAGSEAQYAAAGDVDDTMERLQEQQTIAKTATDFTTRIEKTQRPLREREGKAIRQSLLALVRCVNALADQSFPPFRESKLTRLLQPALQTAYTAVVCTVDPTELKETLYTLRFGTAAASIRLTPSQVRTLDGAQLLTRVQAEAARTRERLAAQVQHLAGDVGGKAAEIAALEAERAALRRKAAAQLRQLERERETVREKDEAAALLAQQIGTSEARYDALRRLLLQSHRIAARSSAGTDGEGADGDVDGCDDDDDDDEWGLARIGGLLADPRLRQRSASADVLSTRPAVAAPPPESSPWLWPSRGDSLLSTAARAALHEATPALAELADSATAAALARASALAASHATLLHEVSDLRAAAAAAAADLDDARATIDSQRELVAFATAERDAFQAEADALRAHVAALTQRLTAAGLSAGPAPPPGATGTPQRPVTAAAPPSSSQSPQREMPPIPQQGGHPGGFAAPRGVAAYAPPSQLAASSGGSGLPLGASPRTSPGAAHIQVVGAAAAPPATRPLTTPDPSMAYSHGGADPLSARSYIGTHYGHYGTPDTSPRIGGDPDATAASRGDDLDDSLEVPTVPTAAPAPYPAVPLVAANSASSASTGVAPSTAIAPAAGPRVAGPARPPPAAPPATAVASTLTAANGAATPQATAQSAGNRTATAPSGGGPSGGPAAFTQGVGTAAGAPSAGVGAAGFGTGGGPFGSVATLGTFGSLGAPSAWGAGGASSLQGGYGAGFYGGVSGWPGWS